MKSNSACLVCGAPSELAIAPSSELPASFVLTTTCDRCGTAHETLTPEQVADLTGHAYDGATSRWSRLVSTSVEGWVP